MMLDIREVRSAPSSLVPRFTIYDSPDSSLFTVRSSLITHHSSLITLFYPTLSTAFFTSSYFGSTPGSSVTHAYFTTPPASITYTARFDAE